MKRLLILFACVVFASCWHKKEVVQITTVPASPNPKIVNTTFVDSSKAKIDTLNNYRFILSFYSIGAGRDMNAFSDFLKYLQSYQQKTNKMIITEETPWGREGEVDYCMKLKELTANEQVDFISNLKKALADAKWVHYFENSPCRYKNQ